MTQTAGIPMFMVGHRIVQIPDEMVLYISRAREDSLAITQSLDLTRYLTQNETITNYVTRGKEVVL